MQYTIVGDTAKYKDCLIYVLCGDLAHAKQTLKRMLTNPNKDDLRVMEGHSNIRIAEVEDSKAWWNDSFLVN